MTPPTPEKTYIHGKANFFFFFFFFYYEDAFIKAGDSETRKGLAQRKKQEGLEWAALAH